MSILHNTFHSDLELSETINNHEDNDASRKRDLATTADTSPTTTLEEMHIISIVNCWNDPRTIDSGLHDAWDVIRSIFSTVYLMARSFFSKIFPALHTRGDDVNIVQTVNLLNGAGSTEETRQFFYKNLRLISNHAQIIYGEYRHLCPPLETINFIDVRGEDDENEQQSLRLRLPESFAQRNENGENMGEMVTHFGEYLSREGFVAYKNGAILLHPASHFAAALLYDMQLKKVCIHVRDTASDSFWENGSSINWLANFMQQMGMVPHVYAMGDLFIYCCAQIFGRENLVLTGYSMGGGIAIFCGMRYQIQTVGLNAAFPSKYHDRYFSETSQQWSKNNLCVFATSNDILSQYIDNPATGGLSPTRLPNGTTVYITPSARSRFGRIFDAIRGHYLSEILMGMFHELRHSPEADDNARFFQLYASLPRHIKDAFAEKFPDDVAIEISL
ncbi:MAG: hypothetical protein LBG86_01400 [Puniceicoccales bacterium]|jgi:hypothetical protein|nr:hypothetical protein [Puniceicoccales bacterium]